MLLWLGVVEQTARRQAGDIGSSAVWDDDLLVRAITHMVHFVSDVHCRRMLYTPRAHTGIGSTRADLGSIYSELQLDQQTFR